MKIFGYTITRRPFWGRVMPWMLFCWMLITLFQALDGTHFFAPFRYGDAIIPKQEQLIKSGPYFIKIHPIRSFYDVEFVPSSGGETYVVDSTVFRLRAHMRDVAEQNEDHAVAYLWTYAGNPVLKVWQVDVGEQNVLTYDEAFSNYKASSQTAVFMLYLSGISFFCLIWSLITVKRSK